ncbi:MAG: tetratricopeptide repeat protein [Myxococcales bacterium]|nr:tetratricopeptide repeat protein [Myxococcales bacterium]
MDDSRIEEARAVFEQAETAYAAGRFIEAAAGYERSYALLVEAGRDTAPLVLFNIASSYDRAGRLAEARAAYQRFVDEARGDIPGIGDRVEQARARVAVLGPGAAPGPEPVLPQPPAESPPAPSSGGVSPVGPIVLAAGGALVVAGLVIGGIALGRDGDLGAACPSRQACSAELRGDYDEIRTLALAGDIFWIGGALVAATGLVLTLVLPGGSDTTASLGCGPSGCQARLVRSF